MQITPKDLENRIKAMMLWKQGQSGSEIARDIGTAKSTILRWIARWEQGDYSINGKNNEVLQNLAKECDTKKQESVEGFVKDFMNETRHNIGDLSKLLRKRVKDALDCEEEFQELIRTVWDDPDLRQDEKQKIVSKINQMTLADTSKLTTMIGTLIDKHQLLDGKATERVEGDLVIKKFEDIEE